MELDQLLAEADFICVCVPLLDATRHLIGAREFALMREHGIFLNVSRGQVVDEAALIDALQRGGICAAGLDVFAQEPLPGDSPLVGAQAPNGVAPYRLGDPRGAGADDAHGSGQS